ncbi:MAG: hypothetical protein GF418_08035 [Chitinivibrionales bacterium]|nr:hypothetical protein [Chitinivibrionales bacterium]MBD3395562.1 hypothetical protein [Chitinivibrionales bacterium]
MKYIRATKNWGPCACNCGKVIGSGDEFAMVSGSMYLKGHESKATGMIPVVKKQDARKVKK